MGATRRLCTFTLDGRRYGVAVEWVQEVLRAQRVTRLPLAPEAVSGLINLRGRIVPAVDLRRRLGLPARAPGAGAMLVVRDREVVASLEVDAIGDVLEVGVARLAPAPDTVAGPGRELVRGVWRLDDALLVELDVWKSIEDAA